MERKGSEATIQSSGSGHTNTGGNNWSFPDFSATLVNKIFLLKALAVENLKVCCCTWQHVGLAEQGATVGLATLLKSSRVWGSLLVAFKK